MNLLAIDHTSSVELPQVKAGPERLRQAAEQFEAILLMQLTSALNTSGSDDEDSLFGSDSGSGLAKQLFSEQMATTMARSGGIGMADVIMRQFGAADGQMPGGIKALSDVVAKVKSLKEEAKLDSLKPSPFIELPRSSRTSAPPSADGDPSEIEIISTFEDDLRKNGIDESTKGLMLDGRVLNSTRARVVPNAPVVSVDEARSETPTPREISFQKPLSGRISSGFGERFHPIDRTTKFHGGVDIAVPTGTSVGAAGEGTVSFAGPKGGYGNLVIVDHPDGRQTRYAHLSSILVSEGEAVARGQQIARSGSTGKSTGPHLHFEMRENGQVIDPMRILSNVLPAFAEK